MRTTNFHFAVLLSIVTVFSALSGCGDYQLKSIRAEEIIKIDGEQSEWGTALHYFEDEKTAVGVMNNDSTLYVCITTSDRSKMMSVLRAGFIVWFEPANQKGFGIKYPLGPVKGSSFSFRPDKNDRKNFSDLAGQLKKIETEQPEFMILNEDKEFLAGRSLGSNDLGIKIKPGFKRGTFVYEMSVPVSQDLSKRYSIHTLPGDKIRIGFETGEMERPKVSGQENFTGFGGNRGSRSPRSGRGNKRMGRENFEPIDFWIEVTLAAGKI